MGLTRQPTGFSGGPGGLLTGQSTFIRLDAVEYTLEVGVLGSPEPLGQDVAQSPGALLIEGDQALAGDVGIEHERLALVCSS
jgi:hypothetical protein